jgi:hypothetical protein
MRPANFRMGYWIYQFDPRNWEQHTEIMRGPDTAARISKMTVYATLIVGLMTFGVQRAAGQSDQSGAPASGKDTSSAVAGQPFSAIKYVRRIEILPDGKQVIRNERPIIRLARDAEGRVRVEGELNPIPECDQMGSLALLNCPVKNVIVFDPVARTITHWPEGERAGHGASIIKLSPVEFEDAAESTLAVQEDASEPPSDEGEVVTEDLGQKVIEGVLTTGVRTTRTLSAGSSADRTPSKIIREVWTAAEKKLIMKIVAGDPRKEVTVTGLEHFSTDPDPALFHPPAGYQVNYSDRSEFAQGDMGQLAQWQMK